jgi:hypothetical protein
VKVCLIISIDFLLLNHLHLGVSETLVAFIVKAIVLEPQNDFQVDRVLASDDVQRLIDLCVKRLLDNKSSSLDTIKMQVYFDMNYTTRDEFLTEHRRVLGKNRKNFL